MCRGPLPYGHAGATRIFSDSACSFAARRRAKDHTNEQEQRCDRRRRRREQHEWERSTCGRDCARPAAAARSGGHHRQPPRDTADGRTTTLGGRLRCACVRGRCRNRPDADVPPRPGRRFDRRDRRVDGPRRSGSRHAERPEARPDERERRRLGCRLLRNGRLNGRDGRSGVRRRRGRRQARRRDGFRRGRHGGRRLGGGRSRSRRRRHRVVARRRDTRSRGRHRVVARRWSRRRLGRRRRRQRLRRGGSRGRRQRRSRGHRRDRRRERRQEAEGIEVALVVRVHADAEVNVRNVELGRPARPDRPDRRALRDDGALRDVDRAEMRERDGERVGRKDRDALSARGHRPGERDLPGRRRDDGRARRGTDVDAAVLPTRVRVRRIERERREHRAGHGPRPRTRCRDAYQRQRTYHHHDRPHDDSLLLSGWKTRRVDASEGVGCCQF